MRWSIAAAVALTMAGCNRSSGTAENQLSANEKSTAPIANVPEPNAGAAATNEQANESASPDHVGTLPPANAGLRFVGRWARGQQECASNAWRFTAAEITGSGAPHCSIYNVSKVPGGYDLAVQCPEKKPIPTDLIKVRFEGSAGAMLVESNAIAPTGLVYCGK